MPAGLGSRLTSLVLRTSPIQQNPPCQTTNTRKQAVADADFPIVNNVGTNAVYQGDGLWRIEKTSGGAGYNADAVGTTALTGDFYLRLAPALAFNGAWLGGMTTDPLADSSYASVDYGLLTDGSNWYVFENSVNVGSPIPVSGFAWIWRSGTTLGYGTGANLATAMASPARALTTSDPLYFDSSFAADGTIIEIKLDDFIPLAYSLAADVGSYSITGASLSFIPARKLVAAPGSYTLTGTATGLRIARKLVLTPGSYTLAGTTTALRRGYSISLTPGAYSLTGTATGVRAARRLIAAVGSYVLTGTTTGLRIARKLTAAVGSYSITGTAATLRTARRLASAPGSYSLTGQSSGLALGLAATSGSYGLTGSAVTLTYTPSSSGLSLIAVPGAYSLIGTPASLRVARKLRAATAHYAITGFPVQLIYTSIWIPAEPDTLTFPVDEPDAATWTPTVPPVPAFVNIEQATATWTDQTPGTWQ